MLLRVNVDVLYSSERAGDERRGGQEISTQRCGMHGTCSAY